MKKKLKEEIEKRTKNKIDDFDEILNDITTGISDSLSESEKIEINNFAVKEIIRKFKGLKIISEK